jgi:acid stress chaperone HdeB
MADIIFCAARSGLAELHAAGHLAGTGAATAPPQRDAPMKMRVTKMLASLLAAVVLTVSAPVHAQQLDLSTVKCKEFLASGKDNIGYILMWLEGYYSDEKAPPIVDFDKMKTNGGKLGEYCAKNADHSLITAADAVLVK